MQTATYSVDVAPLWPELKLSTYRTQRCSNGAVVPPEVTQTILLAFPFSGETKIHHTSFTGSTQKEKHNTKCSNRQLTRRRRIALNELIQLLSYSITVLQRRSRIKKGFHFCFKGLTWNFQSLCCIHHKLHTILSLNGLSFIKYSPSSKNLKLSKTK